MRFHFQQLVYKEHLGFHLGLSVHSLWETSPMDRSYRNMVLSADSHTSEVGMVPPAPGKSWAPYQQTMSLNLLGGYGARITQLRYSRIPNSQILCEVKNGKFPDYFLHNKELVHHSTLSRQYHFLLYKTEVSARSSTFSPHFLRSLGKLLWEEAKFSLYISESTCPILPWGYFS